MPPRVLALIAFLAGISAPSAAQTPPHYKLQIGDWLIYDREVFVRHRDESVTRARDQIRIWCLGAEGREHLLLFDYLADVDKGADSLFGLVAFADERGRLRFPPESATRLAEVEPALDLLPALRSALQAGPAWQSEPDLYGRRWSCQPSQTPAIGAAELVFDFEIEDTGGAAAALRQSTTGRFRFDTTGGVVTKLESVHTDERLGTLTRSLATLKHRVRNEDRWCEQRVAEVRRWLHALSQEDALASTLIREPPDSAAAIARIERLWDAFVVDTDGRAKSPLRALGVARRARLRADAERLRARTAAAAYWLGRRPPPWMLQDAAGHEIASESFRGSVVVECFWACDSLSGVRALETMRALQRELGPERCVVICLNVDVDLSAALRAIDACGRDLRHALGSSLREAEGVPELPVFRVRDHDGVVRGVAFGWRPSITELVTPLLAESPKRP